MNNARLLLVLLPLMSACPIIKPVPKLKDQMKMHSGIWIMDDAVAMRTFLSLDPEPKGPYCMDFQPLHNRAFVRFLDQSKLFKLNVISRGNGFYLLARGNNARQLQIQGNKDFLIAIYAGQTSVYGELEISVDGHRSPFYTLNRCVDEESKGPWTSEYWTKNFSATGDTPWQKRATSKHPGKRGSGQIK